MIYTKKANFPYPILMNYTDDYKDAKFELDVTLRDNADDYIMDISWKINSDFIKKQLKSENASLMLIIKSKDNQFYKIKYSKNAQICIPKSKLCINTKTVIQLMIKTNTNISFKENEDLNEFYCDIKEDIQIKAGMVLGFSNIVIFDGSQQKPYDLFERKVDKKIKSDIEIRLGEETIILVYKNEELQFSSMQNAKELNYVYLYMGLQRALSAFLIHVNTGNAEEGVYINEIDPPENALDSKLYSLMQSKNITELNMDNIDEVICKISDKLIMRYTDAVRGLQNGN